MKSESTYDTSMTFTVFSFASETYYPPWPMAHSKALDLKVEAESLLKKENENLDLKSGL